MILSLFCGAGGLDLGFEKEGFEIGLAFDSRESSVDTYNYNRPLNNGHVKDVRDLTIETLDKLYGREFRPTGVLGGPPCQSFSISNVHTSENDPRHSLTFAYSKLLQELNERDPIKFFIFENVLGLKSKKHSKIYAKFKESFEKAGFRLQEFELNASHFGVPQNRKRIFILGLNKDLFPDYTFSFKVKDIRTTVRNAISDLPDPITFEQYKSGVRSQYHINHWCMTPKSKKFFTPGALISGKAIGRSFRVLEWDKPSPTVAYGNREVHIHPNRKRRLSVHEAALLQSFPFNYEFQGTMSSQFLQVSEAVPPKLAEQVAIRIKEALCSYN